MAAAPSTLDFEPNMGQTDPQVRYMARHGMTRVFVTDRGAVFTTAKAPLVQEMRAETGSIDPKKVKIDVQAIQMTLVGGRKPLEVKAWELHQGTSNYYIGNDSSKWHSNVPQYGRVVSKSVYPGVDIAYYGQEGKLEYDFIVAPGADPKQIHLAFDGQKSMHVASNGDLVLATEFGDFIQGKPKVYQDVAGRRVEIASAYTVSDGKVGFELARYDAKKPLVIDPTLVSSSYFGGSSVDSITSISHSYLHYTPITTPHTYIVVGGFTASADFPANFGSYHGSTDAFIAILDPTTSSVFQAAYVGGSQLDIANSVTADPNSSMVCLGGFTLSPDLPFIQGLYDGSSAASSSNPEGFITCFTGPTPSLSYNLLQSPPYRSTYVGTKNASITSVSFSIDTGFSQDFLYFGGYGDSGGFQLFLNNGGWCQSVPTNCFTSTNRDGIVGVWDLTTQFVRLAEVGGSGFDQINSVSGGENGVVAVGSTQSTDLAVHGSNGFQSQQLFGTISAMVYYGNASLSSQGGLAYYGGNTQALAVSAFTHFGGIGGIDFGMAGTSTAPSIPNYGGTPVTLSNQGNTDGTVIIANCDPNGPSMTVSYATLFGGSGDDFINDIQISVDTSQAVKLINVVGTTKSPNLPVVNPLPGGSALNGTFDAFVAVISPFSATPTFMTYLGGSSTESGNGLFVDTIGSQGFHVLNDEMFVVGQTGSLDFPIAITPSGAGLYQSSNHGGGGDGFLSHLYLPNTMTLTLASQDENQGNQFSGTAVNFSNVSNCDAPSGPTTFVSIPCHFSPNPGSFTMTVPSTYTDGNGIVYGFLFFNDPNFTQVPTLNVTIQPSSHFQKDFLAYYSRKVPLNISTGGTGSGTFTPATGTLENFGLLTQITAAPNPGSSFTGWTGATPADLAAITNPALATTSILMGAPHNIIANFAPKPSPPITWANPASIPFGSALSGTQLNATTTVPGTFVYNPPVGTVLTTGMQTLSVTFNPTDTVTYSSGTASVKINITPPAMPGFVITRTLTRNGPDVIVNFAVANGNATNATNVMVTTAKFGAVNGTPLPIDLGTIPAGAVAMRTFTLPAVTAGSTAVLSIGGTSSLGNFSSSSRVTLP